jgi:hypothetical protein
VNDHLEKTNIPGSPTLALFDRTYGSTPDANSRTDTLPN